VSYDWRVRAGKPLIRRFSPIVKPLFRANHTWVMRRGEGALQRWLANPQRGASGARAQHTAVSTSSKIVD
jgi:hypothetical protein